MATIAEFEAEWHNPLPYVNAWTSGSTGAPKPIRLLKSDMMASAKATNSFFGISASSRLGLPLSVDYIAGKMVVVRAIAAGCDIVELPVSNLVELPSDVCLDMLSVVPTQLDSLLRMPDINRRVRNLIIGGAPMSSQQIEAASAEHKSAFATYGMTETCSHVALAHLRKGQSELTYRAMPGITFDTDERDCLVINAPSFSFGRLVTNDVVQLRDCENFIWKGRQDNVINCGGLKLHPEQIEKEIATVLPSLQFYLCGTEDAHWGQILTMIYEGCQSDAQYYQDIIHSNLHNSKLTPKKYIAVGSLPRTKNGKIKRRPDKK